MLRSKRIVVTGATRGLGHAIASACAAHGATVGIGYRGNAEPARKLADELRARHETRADALALDVTDAAQVDEAVAAFATTYGGIDGWVNNAGVNLPDLLVSTSDERVRAQIDVNLLGPILCARAVLPIMMRQRAGVILNVSSVAAEHPFRGQAVYAATKGGIEALTRALATEYGKKGVRVLCLRPGPIDTEMLASARALGEPEILARLPLGRIGSAAEVAEYAAFLLSDRASFVTGTSITTDGGYGAG